MFKLNWDNKVPQITIERMDESTHCHEINTEEVVDQPCFHEVKRYLETQEYPKGASVNDKKFLRRFSSKFFLSNGILYKRNQDSTLLRCVDKTEAERNRDGEHEGIFAFPTRRYTDVKKILRAGYYWSTK